jgi:hypothetical protein
MKVKVKDGQTLADIAVQEYGSMAAAMELARLNGLALTDIPTPGSGLQLQDAVYDRTMADYCKVNGVSPATQRDTSGVKLRIFTEEYTKEFE